MSFGHLLDIGEITPSIFSNLDSFSRISTFLTLYNSCVDKALKIPLSYAKFKSIKGAFTARIDDLLRFKSGKKCVRFCAISNQIIFAYKSKNYKNISKFIAKEPKYPVAKLIKMLFFNGNFELFFDANFMFSQFVYDKISHKNIDKDISILNNTIRISQNGRNLLCVIPSFRDFCIDEAGVIRDEISTAIRALKEDKFERVYVVMPRNNAFKRHIEVRHCECENHQIKLVPYTISNKIF